MATITLSDKAPTDAGAISFNFAEGEFDLDGKGTFETDNPGLISNAYAHPWLDVKAEVVDEVVESDYDENDPHDNPAADHLSIWASDEAKEKAAANEAAIQAEAYPDQETPEEPVVPKVQSTPPVASDVPTFAKTDKENN